MSANPETAVPTRRKKLAQGKERSDAALGHRSQNTSSPEGAKESVWPVVPLSEVVAINPRPGGDKLADDSLASFIPMKCVEEESGRFEPLGDRKVAEVRKGYTPFRDGDVIFAKVTPCMENGKAAVMKGLTNGIGFGSTEFFALRPTERLDADFLFHFIMQSSFRRQAARNMTGAVGLRRVPKAYLEQQPIPLPPRLEQRRIVAEIEKQFTRLEAGVAALRRVQGNLKRYRAAVLKAACEGRLVPTEAELAKIGNRKAKFETGEALLARILTERRQNWQGRGKYKAPAATPDIGTLPELLDGWTWASVEQISTKVVDGVHKKPSYVPSGIPFVTVRNLTAGTGISFEKLKYITPEDHEEFVKRANPEPGDVLVSKDGTLGVIRVIKTDVTFSIFVSVAMVKPVIREMSNFLGIALSAPQVQAQMIPKGSGLQHIHLEDLREDCIPLPPLAEQTRIVAEVERRLSVAEELEAVVSANLQRATRLRQSILQKAFT